MTNTPPAQIKHHGMITLSIMLATIMQVLDTTIANVALPSMQGDLGASQDTISWVLTSYIVASAIMTPVTGWLADRFGRKELYLASIFGFVISSMLCGIANGLDEMVMFRIIQGISGAALVPLSQSVLLDINPKERHGQAMAMWGAGIMVGPIIGPTLGGWLTDALSWRWVFFINLPVGIIAFLGIAAFMPEVDKRRRPFDVFGFTMLSLAVGGLQLMLDRGEQLEWFASWEIIIELGVIISAIWIFVIHTLTAEHPFIDPHIFKDRNFVTGSIFIFTIGIVLLATMALLPPILQTFMGYPITTTGLVMMPRGVGTMVSMILVGRLMRVVDARLLILTGLLLTSFSLYQMTQFTIVMSATPLVISGVVQGLGLGLVFVPMSTIAFATLPPRFRTDGSALFSLVRNIGSSIGISIVITFLARNTQAMHSSLVSNITPYSLPTRQFAETMGLSVTSPEFLAQMKGAVTRQSLMVAYLDDFYLMMFITLAAAPLLFILKSPNAKPATKAPPSAAAADAH